MKKLVLIALLTSTLFGTEYITKERVNIYSTNDYGISFKIDNDEFHGLYSTFVIKQIQNQYFIMFTRDDTYDLEISAYDYNIIRQKMFKVY